MTDYKHATGARPGLRSVAERPPEKKYSPIQVCTQALENTASCLRMDIIPFLACFVLALSRLKGMSTSLVADRGEKATYVYKLVLERAGWILLRRSVKFRR